MKRTSKPRYVGLDAKTAAELGELLTQKCEELREYRPEVKWCLENGYSAILIYEEHFEIPENIAEEYELRGDGYYCDSCPFKEPITDGRARHRWRCKRRPAGTDIDCKACVFFYEQLEKGEVFK